jgi:hypothetical protein
MPTTVEKIIVLPSTEEKVFDKIEIKEIRVVVESSQKAVLFAKVGYYRTLEDGSEEKAPASFDKKVGLPNVFADLATASEAEQSAFQTLVNFVLNKAKTKI